MAILKPKRGSGLPTGLQQNELAVDIVNKRIYLGNTGGTGDIVSSHITSYVTSINGSTGVVTSIAKLTDDQVFTRLQRFTSGISAAGSTFFGLTRFTSGLSASGATFTGDVNFSALNGRIIANRQLDISGSGVYLQGISTGAFVGPSIINLPNDGTSLSISCGNGILEFDNSSQLSTGKITTLSFNTFQSNGLDEYYSKFRIGPATDPGTNLTYNAYLPADTGTIALTKNVVSSFNGLTGAVTGVTTGTANTFVQLQSFNSGVSSAGGTFSGNINLQNAEFIRNTTNGRMDFMPSPSGSGNYGLYADFTSWGFGARLGTIRSSDQALNVGAVLFDTDCVLQGSRTFSMEQSQTIKFLASGPDSGNNNTLQVTVSQDSGKTGNAFVLMDANSTGYGTTRVPNANFPNPNFFIYSGTNTRVNANDFIRFEHDVNNGRIVSGGTSGINLEPGSGIVGVSGGISAGSFILNSSGIKTLTGTTYTFLASDNGTVLTHNNSSGCTFTVPTGLPVGYSTTVLQLNSAGTVRFIAASGVTLNAFNNFSLMAGQHASASLISYTTNIFNLSGNLI